MYYLPQSDNNTDCCRLRGLFTHQILSAGLVAISSGTLREKVHYSPMAAMYWDSPCLLEGTTGEVRLRNRHLFKLSSLTAVQLPLSVTTLPLLRLLCHSLVARILPHLLVMCLCIMINSDTVPPSRKQASHRTECTLSLAYLFSQHHDFYPLRGAKCALFTEQVQGANSACLVIVSVQIIILKIVKTKEMFQMSGRVSMVA